jgi:hypothetical protein
MTFPPPPRLLTLLDLRLRLLFAAGVLLLLGLSTAAILALDYRVDNFGNTTKHQLAPLLREEDEGLEEDVEKLSHERVLPVEGPIKPLND